MFNIDKKVCFKEINNIVFGGAGFLGSHLIDKLLAKDENVVCIDNLSTGSLKNIIHHKNNKNFIFINHDVTDKIISKKLIQKIWLLACPASPNIYLLEPIKTIRINYEGTLNVLNLALDSGSKVLFASTSEIYGLTTTTPQYESMPINLLTNSPRACYSEGKRIGETLLSTYKKIYNVDIKIARIFNTYGPRLDLNDGRVICNFINQCLKGKKITIFGNGKQTRSFCYVSDLIDGLLKLMDSNLSIPINLGNNNEISIIDLADLIQIKLNTALPYEYHDLPLDDPKLRKPSIEKANRFLNWFPEINLLKGLDKTIKYYKNL